MPLYLFDSFSNHWLTDNVLLLSHYFFSSRTGCLFFFNYSNLFIILRFVLLIRQNKAVKFPFAFPLVVVPYKVIKNLITLKQLQTITTNQKNNDKNVIMQFSNNSNTITTPVY